MRMQLPISWHSAAPQQSVAWHGTAQHGAAQRSAIQLTLSPRVMRI